jgi:hypothetical protein
MEIWRDVTGYEGIYQVSNYGKVKSLYKKQANIVTPHIDKKGYHIIRLWRGGNQDTRLLHRLVAQAFVPNHANKPHINHKDGNKSNNYWSNLEWCTPSENNKHSFAIGLKTITAKQKARASQANSKPIYQLDRFNNIVRRWPSITLAAKTLGFSLQHISNCCRGSRKTCGGFVWAFEPMCEGPVERRAFGH